jgi:hypothetical protein
VTASIDAVAQPQCGVQSEHRGEGVLQEVTQRMAAHQGGLSMLVWWRPASAAVVDSGKWVPVNGSDGCRVPQFEDGERSEARSFHWSKIAWGCVSLWLGTAVALPHDFGVTADLWRLMSMGRGS